MAVEYYTPSKDELLAAIRVEFAYLVSEYGYTEPTNRPERYVNPYSVLYRRGEIEVLVEGISYGSGTTIELRIRDTITGSAKDQFCVGWITTIRRPDLQIVEFPEKRGQLIQLPRFATELRAVADDLLRGDLSILPQVRTAIAEARKKAEVAGKNYEFRRAEAVSQRAFRDGDLAAVVSALEPHRDVLNRSSRKRLEIAKSRMGDPQCLTQVIVATSEFRPGFRFSPLDAFIIVAGAVGSLLTWPRSWWIGFVIAFVVLHFFLFCNVFRISRRLELSWAVIFIILTRLTVRSGFPSWTVTVLLSLAVTIVVVGIEMKKPSYHGVWWQRVNPNLREWWDASMGLKIKR